MDDPDYEMISEEQSDEVSPTLTIGKVLELLPRKNKGVTYD